MNRWGGVDIGLDRDLLLDLPPAERAKAIMAWAREIEETKRKRHAERHQSFRAFVNEASDWVVGGGLATIVGGAVVVAISFMGSCDTKIRADANRLKLEEIKIWRQAEAEAMRRGYIRAGNFISCAGVAGTATPAADLVAKKEAKR